MPQYPAAPYKVKSGDTLSGIAQSMMGSHKEWPRIYALNNIADVLSRGGARISNPDQIRAGDTIYLPAIGPPRAPVRSGDVALTQRPAMLMPLVGSTVVPYAIAHDIKSHEITLDYGTHIARVSITCRFALTRSSPVLLTQVMGRAFEMTAQTEAGTTYTKLVSDTKVSFDPKANSVGVSCGLIVHANGVDGPKAVLGIARFTPFGMPVLRAEIKLPELKGNIGGGAYVATGVKFTVEIEPRSPLLQPVPIRVASPRQAMAPQRQRDLNDLFQTPPLEPTVVVTLAVLGAGFALWVFLPLVVGLSAAQLAASAGAILVGTATMAH